jgi:hypothetical protein
MCNLSPRIKCHLSRRIEPLRRRTAALPYEPVLHADKFLLKGAMLLAMWYAKTPHSTQDVDLLSFGPSELEEVEVIVGSGRSQAIPTRCNFAPPGIRRVEASARFRSAVRILRSY